MEVGRGLILGVVQGLTEFLPVSSSGHLVIFRELFRWADSGLAFDAALHLGTLLAVLVFFRRRWIALLRGREPALFRALILGTIPAALFGWWGSTALELRFRSGSNVGAAFLATAAVLFLADRIAARERGSGATRGNLHVPGSSALLVGLAQVVALLPGISRAGVTIGAGMLLGLTRTQAVEFSFLLALPILAAAGLFGLRSVATAEPALLPGLGAGFIAAFVAGWAAIGFLLRTIRTRSLLPYVGYLVLLGVLLLVVGS